MQYCIMSVESPTTMVQRCIMVVELFSFGHGVLTWVAGYGRKYGFIRHPPLQAKKKLTREECEVLLRAIGKKIRKLAVEYYL